MGLFTESSSIEKAVVNATDESLITEDWSRIINVCDKVNSSFAKNGPDAVKALIKRLQVPNGNVQLFSLTLLNSLVQNCGPALHREVAAHPMASALQRLGTSQQTHRSVIVRLLDILSQIAETFSKDASLNQIEMVLHSVQKAHPQLSNPSAPNSVPKKAKQVEEDDEDLKRALELSLQEMQIKSSAPAKSIRPHHFVKAVYDFTASENGELSFKQGDVIEVVDKVYKEWWKGILNNREGIFPVNYVEDLGVEVNAGVSNTPPPEPVVEITEDYIFTQAPQVNKLLEILQGSIKSGQNVIDNEEVQVMFRETAAIRPKLVQLIDEYTMKKKELIDLNQKLVYARRSYDSLLVSATANQKTQPQQPQYGEFAPKPARQPSYDHIPFAGQNLPSEQPKLRIASQQHPYPYHPEYAYAPHAPHAPHAPSPHAPPLHNYQQETYIPPQQPNAPVQAPVQAPPSTTQQYQEQYLTPQHAPSY